jgi:hypothetical protein
VRDFFSRDKWVLVMNHVEGCKGRTPVIAGSFSGLPIVAAIDESIRLGTLPSPSNGNNSFAYALNPEPLRVYDSFEHIPAEMRKAIEMELVMYKINRGDELTRAEADMLNQSGDMDSVKMAKAKIAPEEDVAPSIDERQMSLPGMGSMQRPDRQAAAEEGFMSQQPDLLGDMLPERVAAPAEVDPMEQRVVALTQEFIDGGMAPKEAVVKAYQQARTELQDDNLASLQGAPADPRQGALQFAAPAPEGRGFREEPFNTQMPDQLETQVSRDSAFRQAEQDAAAQKQSEMGAAENQRELQIAEPYRVCICSDDCKMMAVFKRPIWISTDI